MKKRIFLLLFCFSSILIFGQENQWTLSNENGKEVSKKDLMLRNNLPKEYKIYNLKESSFKSKISTTKKSKKQLIEVPTAKGIKEFYIEESSNFSEELAKKYSNIKAFSGYQIDDESIKVKISLGLDGYHFSVYETGKPTFYVESFTKNNKKLIAYYRNSLDKQASEFTCQVKEFKDVTENTSFNKLTNDGLLRTYRIAVVTTGEYSQFQLNRLGISAAASTSVKKEAVLSAVNTTINRNNALFERDLSVRFELVANNDEIVFLDAATDNLTNDNPETLLNQTQSTIDLKIGNSNYDIGHAFSTGAGGLAGLGVICTSGQKGRGVTGISAPFGDEFDIDFVAHELGHQFGANHTFNGTSSNCSGDNRNNATAVEPGSGSTIMGYAGICSAQNIQNDSDDHFHSISITEIRNVILTSGNCAVTTANGNTAPVANAGLDYFIPKSTPFVLKGSATDVDGTLSLTYNWEQIDNEVGFAIPPSSLSSGGALFRSLPSKSSPNRYMPDLTTVISGSTSSTWEVVPSVARDLNFSLTVRDNNATGGATSRDDMTVTVTNASAFTVTSQNSAVTWSAGSSEIVSWNKGTTDIAPISCQNVNIKLSTDGGLTFPITLKSNTPNDGTETIIVPNNITAEARIMVEAADNIFYNVNTTNFTIVSTAPSFILSNTSGDLSACNTGNQSVSYNLNLDFINGFSETVSFSATGQPAGSSVVFSPATITNDGTVIMTISNLNGIVAQRYTVNIKGSSVSVNQNLDVFLDVTASSLNSVNLSSPTDGATNVSLTETLIWQQAINAASYDVEVATDNNFATIISSGNVSTISYDASNLEGNTTYYWRVKAKNNCNESAFSNTFRFTTENPSYCSSTFTDELGGAEHITNVTFNTINNNSGNDTVDGYQDFTTIKTNVKRGDVHQVSVTLDTDGFQDHVYVFIDWNRDYVFNKTDERYDLGTEFNPTGTRTLNINIPNDAAFGATTMRVIIEYYGGAEDFGDGPCDSDHLTEWGETEDYTIIVDNTASIQDTSFTNFNLYPNPNNGTFNLNLEVDIDNKVLVQLFDVRGRLVSEKNYTSTKTSFSEKITFENASSGLYLLKVINGKKQTTKKLLIK